MRALAGRMYGYPNARLYATGRFAVEQLTLPKFLGIGAPKAGTTWLHHNLAAHPDLYLPPEKELHYFTVALHRGMRWYSSRFEDAGARIPGEITPGYIALNQRRIALVRDLMPDCRLILIMRNPVDRAWSHAVMKLARREGRTVESVSDAEFAAHFRGTMSRRRSDYLGTIKRWHAVFPPERLMVASYDEIKEQPQQLLKRAIGHIGASTALDWTLFPYAEVIDRGLEGEDDVFGKTSTPSMPDRHRDVLAALYKSDIEQLADAYPEYAMRWLPQG